MIMVVANGTTAVLRRRDMVGTGAGTGAWTEAETTIAIAVGLPRLRTLAGNSMIVAAGTTTAVIIESIVAAGRHHLLGDKVDPTHDRISLTRLVAEAMSGRCSASSG
jgi:hypothetical protein